MESSIGTWGVSPAAWKAEMPTFRQEAAKYFGGELERAEFKGFAGRFGCITQREEGKAVLRLRTAGGRITKEQLLWLRDEIRRFKVGKLHFTTGQTVQLHELGEEALAQIMEDAMTTGIASMGTSGDNVRNVLCSPLSGVARGEVFDIMPYVQEVSNYVLQYLYAAEKMPRKLKIAFSNEKDDVTHDIFHDLGYRMMPDGTFTVYSGGGLGPNPRMGVEIASGVAPEDVLYYVEAMRATFVAYGDYKRRMKARVRYMVENCGGEDAYRDRFLEKLEEVRQEKGDSLKVHPYIRMDKVGDRILGDTARVTAQKQEKLYAVCWHPIGGCPEPETFCKLVDALEKMDEVEMRLSPEEDAYIINLTADEAKEVLALTEDTAKTLFEYSSSCIGASICQFGIRDSQAALHACVEAVRAAKIPDGALPKIAISGCPSSCSAHYATVLGFRGGLRNHQPAFMMYANGCAEEGQEQIAEQIGYIYAKDMPELLVKLGRTVAESGMTYMQWSAKNPDGLRKLAERYLSACASGK